jgi:hypothetical protein
VNQWMGIHFVIFVFANIEIFGYLFSTSQSTITNHINQILSTCVIYSVRLNLLSQIISIKYWVHVLFIQYVSIYYHKSYQSNTDYMCYLFSTSQSTITNHINQILITCNTKYTITLHQHPSHNILFWWIWKIKDKTLLLSENRIDGLRCSVISRRSVLLVEEIWVPGENHWPVTSHWQTWSHIVVSSTPWHKHGWNSQL